MENDYGGSITYINDTATAKWHIALHLLKLLRRHEGARVTVTWQPYKGIKEVPEPTEGEYFDQYAALDDEGDDVA